MTFTITVLAAVKAPHMVFGRSQKICSLADVRLKELKADLAEITAH